MTGWHTPLFEPLVLDSPITHTFPSSSLLTLLSLIDLVLNYRLCQTTISRLTEKTENGLFPNASTYPWLPAHSSHIRRSPRRVSVHCKDFLYVRTGGGWRRVVISLFCFVTPNKFWSTLWSWNFSPNPVSFELQLTRTLLLFFLLLLEPKVSKSVLLNLSTCLLV